MGYSNQKAKGLEKYVNKIVTKWIWSRWTLGETITYMKVNRNQSKTRAINKTKIQWEGEWSADYFKANK
jgi:hypothetical protein